MPNAFAFVGLQSLKDDLGEICEFIESLLKNQWGVIWTEKNEMVRISHTLSKMMKAWLWKRISYCSNDYENENELKAHVFASTLTTRSADIAPDVIESCTVESNSSFCIHRFYD